MNVQHPPERKGEPNFDNLLAVLRREVPNRSTLFEFALNERLYDRAMPGLKSREPFDLLSRKIIAYHHYGYDYTPILLPDFCFSGDVARRKLETRSFYDGGVIRNREEFEHFDWPNPETADFGLLDRLGRNLPEGMKLVPYSNDGVLENVISLMGYETLCYALADDPQLVEDIFSHVGERLVVYYKNAVQHDSVGACMANDDWGFKSGTLLSTEDLRRLVFPWYERIVYEVHRAGKPVILHSCGHFEDIIEDIIDKIGFDGRHSYEDAVLPVEEAYDRYHRRIAVLGGIDVDFLCRADTESIYTRSKEMLERSADDGAYALGSGNSVPDYLPDVQYFAMIRAAMDMRV